MLNFNNLKKLFTPHTQSVPQEEPIECVEFNDYPVFEIDDKKYYVQLEDSRLTTDVERFLKTVDADEKEPEFVINEKRIYSVPSLNKYLKLIVSVDCELVDGKYYAITHLGIENAFLASSVYGIIEPEKVEELR